MFPYISSVSSSLPGTSQYKSVISNISETTGISQWILNTLAVLLPYAVICHILRFQRVRQKHAQFQYPNRASYSKMTLEDARQIQQYLFQMEFPFTAEKALQFALFRTYGVPTISKLLVETAQLSTKANASRRFVDTVVLIAEFMGFASTSERANGAISRMNYIHSVYQKAGKISNDDMLYTLALFALEPRRWINRYEWRQLTEMETCAIGTFWKSIGDAMAISYEALPSHPSSWRDGLQWLDELEAWSLAYEARCMVPSTYNQKTAHETTTLLLYDVPACLKTVGRHAVSALMDERLRKAMIYPPPPPLYPLLINTAFTIRAFLLRHLALPRPHALRFQIVSEHPDQHGRYHRLVYEAEPWYVPSTLPHRFSPQALLKRARGQPYPARGHAFKPQGYVVQEVGPKNLEGKGAREFEEDVRRVSGLRGSGACPFGV